MPPRALPPHLSYKSALVLLPPTVEPIQEIRRKYDKHFHRWPPHINLIYPFVASLEGNLQQGPASTSSPVPRENIMQRIQMVVKEIKPFEVVLSSAARYFSHSPRSATVWLEPLELSIGETGTEETQRKITGVRGLQAALQGEFEECNADTRVFTPHLSVGQAGGSEEIEALRLEVKGALKDFAESVPLHLEPKQAHGLRWLVDRVFLIARSNSNDPFHVIGEIPLGRVT